MLYEVITLLDHRREQRLRRNVEQRRMAIAAPGLRPVGERREEQLFAQPAVLITVVHDAERDPAGLLLERGDRLRERVEHRGNVFTRRRTLDRVSHAWLFGEPDPEPAPDCDHIPRPGAAPRRAEPARKVLVEFAAEPALGAELV